MRRVLVVGMSGSGKTTAARVIAQRLDLPFHEMDVLGLGPDWSRPPGFEAEVARIVAEPGWVFDSWGYESVRDVMWAAADTIVWLDYPRRVVLPRLLRRSLQRSWTRESVFGGNVETWGGWLSLDHPFWHAVTHLGSRRRYLAERTARETHLQTFRLRTPADLERWLDTLT